VDYHGISGGRFSPGSYEGGSIPRRLHCHHTPRNIERSRISASGGETAPRHQMYESSFNIRKDHSPSPTDF